MQSEHNFLFLILLHYCDAPVCASLLCLFLSKIYSTLMDQATSCFCGTLPTNPEKKYLYFEKNRFGIRMDMGGSNFGPLIRDSVNISNTYNC